MSGNDVHRRKHFWENKFRLKIIRSSSERVWNGSTACSCFPCFRENVVVTCKINWVFLCNLDNLLQKNVIVFFFEYQISKWRSFEKKAIFDLLFTLF